MLHVPEAEKDVRYVLEAEKDVRYVLYAGGAGTIGWWGERFVTFRR